jgi:hypothetical protein
MLHIFHDAKCFSIGGLDKGNMKGKKTDKQHGNVFTPLMHVLMHVLSLFHGTFAEQQCLRLTSTAPPPTPQVPRTSRTVRTVSSTN